MNVQYDERSKKFANRISRARLIKGDCLRKMMGRNVPNFLAQLRLETAATALHDDTEPDSTEPQTRRSSRANDR